MASSSSSEGPIPPWLQLPREITEAILHRLGPIEILTTAQNVCKSWRSVCQDPSMWRSVDMRNSGSSWESVSKLEKMCCRAVDLSQGQLTDITLVNLGCDSVLIYISERSSQLKHLRFLCPDLISDEVMIEAVKKFPLLEELHLHGTPIGVDTIKAIGRSCPLLKSFKLNDHCWNIVAPCDLEALAIAETMPELRYLQLYGNKMTNEGLQAILDGCPHLESVDLRRCNNVQLCGDLAKLCSKRIKDLRHPHESINDSEFGPEMLFFRTSDNVEMASDYYGYFFGGSPSWQGNYDLRHPHESIDDYEFGAEMFLFGTSDDDVDNASEYYGYFSGGSPSWHGNYDGDGFSD